MDTVTKVRTDSVGEIELFLSQIDETAEEYLQRYPLGDDEHCSGEYFTALLRFIYSRVFKPTEYNKSIYERNSYQNSQNSILDYSDIRGLDRIFDSFLGLCARFRQCPSILGYCTMVGVDKDTLTTWKNGSRRNNSPEHMSTTKAWFEVCETALAQRAIMSNSIGSIFALKANFSWRETAPVGIPESTQLDVHETAEQISARHSMTTLPELPNLDDFN